MERQKFEEVWKDAFNDAGLTPNEQVWTNIELDLERKKGLVLQKKIKFYQMLAAASVSLVILAGAWIYFNPGTSQQHISQVNEVKTLTESSEKNRIEEKATEAASDSKSIQAENKASGVKKSQFVAERADNSLTLGNEQSRSSKYAAESNGIFVAKQDGFAKDNVLITQFNNASLPKIAEVKTPVLKLPKEEVETDPVAQMLAKLEAREKELRGEKERKAALNEKTWSSIGFSAGTFKTTNTSVGRSNAKGLVGSATVAEHEAKASGSTYVVGMNVGTKLSERWVIQGGVNYLAQTSEYTANNIVGNSDYTAFMPASINELDGIEMSLSTNANDKRLVSSAPYSVTNNMRYLSVPLQAGYLIVNSALGVQLNAGVATDLFLRSVVSADNEMLTESRRKLGEDSPYRTFIFSGLMGTEVSYKFGDNYRVALTPGLRYSLNNIYRSDVSVKSSPLTLDVGLRFRYIFH